MTLRRIAPLACLASTLALASACDDEIIVDEDMADGDDAEDIGAAEDEQEQAEEEEEEEPKIEACDTLAQMRECSDGSGTQFCYAAPQLGNSLIWGDCLTDFECMPGETQDCGLGEEFGNPVASCEVMLGEPTWNWDACNTPLVLSFDGGPIEMAASSHEFDISGAGMCTSTDWPTAATPWLAIDLDRNGYIDGGHELFGSGTILGTGGHAKNGFVALAPLDGNGDGLVSAADARFGELLVWRDEDGDKLSSPFELTSLADEGVERIDLGFDDGRECDARGNCAGERSRFEFVDRSGTTRVGEVVDVYLSCQ